MQHNYIDDFNKYTNCDCIKYYIGPQGPRGCRGPQGEPGYDGSQGPRGYIGPQGPKGDTGSNGPQGLKGDTGTTGPQGLKGDTGTTGPQGLKGDTGATGPQGLKGDTGTTGPQGLKGDTGTTGPQGLKGDTGTTGPQGLKGDTGAMGPKGDTGPSVQAYLYATIGSVSHTITTSTVSFNSIRSNGFTIKDNSSIYFNETGLYMLSYWLTLYVPVMAMSYMLINNSLEYGHYMPLEKTNLYNSSMINEIEKDSVLELRLIVEEAADPNVTLQENTRLIIIRLK